MIFVWKTVRRFLRKNSQIICTAALLSLALLVADLSAAGHVKDMEWKGFRKELFIPSDAAKPEKELELYATAAVLLDGESGRVLYGKNPDQPLANASTTKVLTCMLILENCDLEEMVSISGYASSMPKVKLGAVKGESYRVEELLYSLMLESHNDSAVALAEHLGKELLSELAEKDEKDLTREESLLALKGFSKLMNQKALAIGCKDSYFITPNGLDATETIMTEEGTEEVKEHHVTARDLALILSHAIMKSPKREEFLRITGAPEYSFQKNGRAYYFQNHNSFLNMMEGACSGKTGFTGKAGYCYVGALQRDGRCYVVSLLACGWPGNRSYKWMDAKKLMEYGLENYQRRSLTEEGLLTNEEELPAILVRAGQGREIGRETVAELTVKGRDQLLSDSPGILMTGDESIQTGLELPAELSAPLEKGQKVGEIQYFLNGQVILTEDVIAKEEIKRIDLGWCLEKILERYLMD